MRQHHLWLSAINYGNQSRLLDWYIIKCTCRIKGKDQMKNVQLSLTNLINVDADLDKKNLQCSTDSDLITVQLTLCSKMSSSMSPQQCSHIYLQHEECFYFNLSSPHMSTLLPCCILKLHLYLTYCLEERVILGCSSDTDWQVCGIISYPLRT